MAFTTWTALLLDMQNGLANFAAGAIHIAKYEYNGRRFEYRSAAELLDAIERIKPLADRESGKYIGRTYAKDGGRG